MCLHLSDLDNGEDSGKKQQVQVKHKRNGKDIHIANRNKANGFVFEVSDNSFLLIEWPISLIGFYL